MNAPGFTRDAIIALLVELETRLLRRGIVMDIQIVGGAALILHGLLERSTEDIDAEYSNKASTRSSPKWLPLLVWPALSR